MFRFIKKIIATATLFIACPLSTFAASICTTTADCDSAHTNRVCVYAKMNSDTTFDTTSGVCVVSSALNNTGTTCASHGSDCTASGPTPNVCVGTVTSANTQPAATSRYCIDNTLVATNQTSSASTPNTTDLINAKLAYEKAKADASATHDAALAAATTEQQKTDADAAYQSALAHADTEFAKASAENMSGSGTINTTGSTLSSNADVPIRPLPIKLNVAIPGVTFSTPDQITASGKELSIPYIGQYVAGVFNYALTLLPFIAVIVILFAGFLWATAAGNAATIKHAQEMIVGSVSGVVIMLFGYTILSVINPHLTTLQNIGLSAVTPEPFKLELPAAAYTAITGQPLNTSPGSRSEFKSKAGARAAQSGLPPCFGSTIVQFESGGNPAVIGHDENYPGPNRVPARIAFLRSLKRFSGKTFTLEVPIPSGDIPSANRAAINHQKISNDDGGMHVDPSKMVAPDYGIDWRFSHGLGLGQVTIAAGARSYCTKDGQKVRGTLIKALNKCVSVPELLTVDGAIEALVGRLLYWYKAAGGVPGTPQEQVPEAIVRKTFGMYGAGGGGGNLQRDSVNKRVSTFFSCIKNPAVVVQKSPDTATGATVDQQEINASDDPADDEE